MPISTYTRKTLTQPSLHTLLYISSRYTYTILVFFISFRRHPSKSFSSLFSILQTELFYNSLSPSSVSYSLDAPRIAPGQILAYHLRFHRIRQAATTGQQRTAPLATRPIRMLQAGARHGDRHVPRRQCPRPRPRPMPIPSSSLLALLPSPSQSLLLFFFLYLFFYSLPLSQKLIERADDFLSSSSIATLAHSVCLLCSSAMWQSSAFGVWSP